MTGARPAARWPLFLIAAPAAVAIWSGWVGLGTMCGFGIVHPLPGIADGFELNTAITLPVGVEAYGAYALGAWLGPAVPAAARRFARRSAVGAVVLGMAGQVIYHLLAAAHQARAPWPVVVLVSCLPVVTLGFGAALAHLLRHVVPVPEPVPASVPIPGCESVPGSVPVPAEPGEPLPARTRTRVTPGDAEREFMTELAAGKVPAIREVRARLRVGQDRAVVLRAHLAALAAAPAGEPEPAGELIPA